MSKIKNVKFVFCKLYREFSNFRVRACMRARSTVAVTVQLCNSAVSVMAAVQKKA